MALNRVDEEDYQQEPTSRRRRWAINLALIAASIVFALLLGEILLRLTYVPQVPTIPHRIYHHTRPTNSTAQWTSSHDEYDTRVSFNSLSLRGSEPDLTRDHLLLFLGDSMIEGLQVTEEETLCHQLEVALGGSHTVLNAGVGGYSPILMWLRFRELLQELPRKPDTVLLALFPNDLEEEYLYRSIAYKDQKGEVIAVTPSAIRGPIGRLRTLAFKNLYLVRILQKSLGAETVNRNSDIDPLDPSDKVLFPFRYNWTESERTVWAEIFRSIGDTKRLCDSEGIELILVIVPPGHQVSPDAWKTGKQTMNFKPDAQVESTTFQEEITNRSRRIGIRSIDLLPEFKEHPTPQNLYFDFDGHWTAKGNEFAAKVLLKKLDEVDEIEETP